ncbi:hypothetical protein [Marixanthomonas spongiae]|uniref:Uncharacterized protein n=1 Tax=Marixanthomonas spongiae TaxID=2174845 RepID=A0A2U0HZ97_9FLAO|nr:hypothetical protein [Marixanthomonas spongiae]PVW14146.1 hypothetical protein DDV96_10040 [Marixanthomonas spongiae]
MITKHVLHTARLNNNCPECYDTSGLEFTFTQQEKHTAFYHKANKQIDEKLYCHTCNNTIYPVNWTEDIERVYQYHKKQAHPKATYLRLKPLAYGLILLGIVAVGAMVYMLITF